MPAFFKISYLTAIFSSGTLRSEERMEPTLKVVFIMEEFWYVFSHHSSKKNQDSYLSSP